MELRPRQLRAVDAIINELKKHKNTLMVAPTGSGKTIIFSALINRFLSDTSYRACVLSNRKEML